MENICGPLNAAASHDAGTLCLQAGGRGDQVLGVTDLIQDIIQGGFKSPDLDLATLGEVHVPEQQPALLLDLSGSASHPTVANSGAHSPWRVR